MYVHIKTDHHVEMELSPECQTAEKYLSNEPRMEGVDENVDERKQFEVVNCEIVKLSKTPLKFCSAKCNRNHLKMYTWAFRCYGAQ